MTYTHWHAKLAAWTHDPAEKALVLLRDPAGHEGGTVAALQQLLFGAAGLPAKLREVVRRADHWASAADRPQWPRQPGDGRFPPWAQVRFTESPVLIHPLAGGDVQLQKLAELDVAAVKKVSLEHFRDLIDDDPEYGARRTALAFWRFGPETPAPELGALWGLLPADTRVPDHTIWQHLDLTAAFASAFHRDPDANPALLTVSLGPVQDFIAQARSTSDLWAGSHLLSRLAWEGMKVVSESLGPDAILFPQLRGVPEVDRWLRDQVGLSAELFKGTEWQRSATDSNPLFAAALPNRFLALVPAAEAQTLAARITDTVRQAAAGFAERALDQLREAAGLDTSGAAWEQLREQLEGFPEVHWAVAPWEPMIQAPGTGEAPGTGPLAEALATFQPPGHQGGFLGSPVWKLLAREVRLENHRFFTPNPGTLYPALHDLLERAQGAAKSARVFRQLPQEGYRCSLCGEREWLTHDRDLLSRSPRQQTDSLWARARRHRPSIARKGEHLCAPCALKRLWPWLFAAEVGEAIGAVTGKAARYVVSTHTMALATSLDAWLDNRALIPPQWLDKLEGAARDGVVALPRKLARHLGGGADREVRAMLRGLPAFLEQRQDEEASPETSEREQAASLAHDLVQQLRAAGVLAHRPEAYYALVLMDGDRMGAWLSGTDEGVPLAYADTWHPQVRQAVTQRCQAAGGPLAQLPAAMRPVSPARHMAISSALNSFALQVARHVVEDLFKGKLIYAGGDDLLAMVSVDDLLPVMGLLRLAYSGVFPSGQSQVDSAWGLLLGARPGSLELGQGYARLHGRLHRMMGHRATASMGAVVAHHQAPLGKVIRHLRSAEKKAKEQGGRDAFHISLLKRSGGAVELTCPWLVRAPGASGDWNAALAADLQTSPMGQLIRLRDRFAEDTFSRRAAYLTQGWLPHARDPAALRAMLGYQFRRQGAGVDADTLATLGETLAELACSVSPAAPGELVEAFLGVAEFLGREGRSGRGRSNRPAATGKEGLA